MKNKITFKLTLYFSLALVILSVVIGSVFIILFRNHTIEIQKSDLQNRAETMANSLDEIMNSTRSGMMNGKQGSYGAYLKFINNVATTDVWVVDEDLQLITSGHMNDSHFKYKDLPHDAETVVSEVFKGETTFSEGFSSLLNKPTLTVGTPIKSNGTIVGALLLHSPVEGITEAVSQGFNILVLSIILALVLAILFSVILALNFTKPLKKMKKAALLLSDGNYNAQTGVKQNDEIGELALTIDALSVKLDQASRESEKLDQLRRDFIANISHELRTPVTVIRGSLEAICDEVVTDSEQVKNYHRQMLAESIYLQRMVNDLLDLSRLQNIDFKIEMQEISLCDVLNDVVRSAQHIAEKQNIKINFEQDSQICIITGDYNRLRQMFLIILDNAIKFSPQNDVVNISSKDKTVTISDNGIGIAREDLPHIFDRFYKVKSEQNKNGTGLGLAIAKQIAQRHNINISVNSKENIGTSFIFRF